VPWLASISRLKRMEMLRGWADRPIPERRIRQFVD
jgi:hypothetical protein